MKTLFRHWRYYGLLLAANGLYFLDGCGLSDQQLATIWQSVIQTGLNTIVSDALSQATTAAG
jgi:hypothetical protein